MKVFVRVVMMFCVAALWAAAGLCVGAVSGQVVENDVVEAPTTAEIESRYDAGAKAFAEGLEFIDTDPTTARERFNAAAATWEEIVAQTGLASGAMQYNIGNARLLAGDVGRAVLAYRRAQRHKAGGGARVDANLAQARTQVRTKIDGGARGWFWRILFFWHDAVPGVWRFGVFFAAFVFCWLWFGARLALQLRGQAALRASMGRWPGLAAGALAFVLFGSVWADDAGWFVDEAGVVLRETVGRKGPSASGYGPSFSDPLWPGVEFVILESRSGWLFVELADGRTTWIDRADVGVV